ncbi:MAG: DUF58 domain-containing protein [Myxococcota bacterium]|nr:DUF58 domain-containing protein [Myxococcota bacterium]
MTDLSIIQKVKRLHIRTRHQVADVLAGAYLSVFKGSGIEFEEVRPYVPGDEIRSIDWNVTARTGVPHVKRFVEERELTIMLLVDISGSQEFGSSHQSKREAASEFAALLAFSAIANKDKVGLILFHSDTELFIPPRKGQKHAMRVVREVLAHDGSKNSKDSDLPWLRRWMQFLLRTVRKTGRKTDISAALEFCRRVLPRKSVLFVISDFMDAGYLSTMRNVNRKHDVVAALVTDPGESAIPNMGLLELRDAESGASTIVDSTSVAFQEHLQRTTASRVNSLQQELRASGIDLIHIDTTSPVIDPLLAFLRMRERRIQR